MMDSGLVFCVVSSVPVACSPLSSFSSLSIKPNPGHVGAPTSSTATTVRAWGTSQILRASASRSPILLHLDDSSGDVPPSHAGQEREQLCHSLVS